VLDEIFGIVESDPPNSIASDSGSQMEDIRVGTAALDHLLLESDVLGIL
jgi:hypothetical protein